MARAPLAIALVAALAVLACGGSTLAPSAPSPPAAANSSSPTTPAVGTDCSPIGFDKAGANGTPFTSYTACTATVAATTSNWTVSTAYGHPAPFIQFVSTAGVTTTGEIAVTAGGAKFRFQSVDVYSSTTRIPYTLTGIADSATVFTLDAVQGNTFGNFATLTNPNARVQIDKLVIRLTNPAAACCGNPMGLDNIVIVF